tara:strand:+ start:20909 stop:21412 length:504 start_codon:yes stop_codon:yes gene_type:complete
MTTIETIQAEAQVFKDARAVLTAVRESNRPIAAKNRKIREENAKITELNKENDTRNPPKPFHPWNPMPPKESKILDRDSRQRELLAQRSELEWLQLLRSSFRGKKLQKIACIVFWDYAGDKLGHERWEQFEDFIDVTKRINLPRDEKVEALYSLGYPAHAALTRIPS